ncbi:hypothetical protein [Bacteroides graminisolvens]
MNRHHALKAQIQRLFPDIYLYVEVVSAKHIHVQEYESDHTTYILKDIDSYERQASIDAVSHKLGKIHFAKITIPINKDKWFSIVNSKTIYFIPIDGKKGLLGGISNCDFIFWNKKDFCFVELKLNATATDDRAIRKNRQKAISQLKETIFFFDGILNKDYFGLNLEAYVSTPDIYPRENTAWQSLKVEFLEKTGIDLFEKRAKIY